MTDFMDMLKKSAFSAQNNVSVTENGAKGYKTTGKKLVDLNFMLSSMRNMDENEIWSRFLDAYNENPNLAVLWLFFARDCRGGCGERRVFRTVFSRLCRENNALAARLLHLIPFYGRWDDLIDLICDSTPCSVRNKAVEIVEKQFGEDLDNARAGKPISLLAKWMPSLNTSSKKTMERARIMRSLLAMTPRDYRRTLSTLRCYLDVTEKKMSAGEWGKIDYSSVPSRASMNYRDAFSRHDGQRYGEFLDRVSEGSEKINAGTLFPYDIVHAYMLYSWKTRDKLDNTLEAQWKALPNTVPDNQSTLVVVDGSGSMCTPVGNTSVSCLDVARSLGIYFAEKLKGPYHNRFVTFSASPQYVDFNDCLSLLSKLQLMEEYDECENTDIEKVFDLVLETARANHLRQEEIPANILVVSDMEFDEGTYFDDDDDENAALFETIRRRWENAGYKLPRLVFWNVCSRTGTIPLAENELGVALVSGFSPSIADMVMSCDLDPYKCLVNKLMGERYLPVIEALKE